MIDLEDSQLTEVERILSEWVPGYQVLAFGSRVQNTAGTFSDLDLVLMGEEPVEFHVPGDLRHAFAESNLSIHVDVLDWNRLSNAFRQTIASTPFVTVQTAVEAFEEYPVNR